MCESSSRSFHYQAKIKRKTFISPHPDPLFIGTGSEDPDMYKNVKDPQNILKELQICLLPYMVRNVQQVKKMKSVL